MQKEIDRIRNLSLDVKRLALHKIISLSKHRIETVKRRGYVVGFIIKKGKEQKNAS